MTAFALVRHGETEWNRARRIQGSTDIPLNDTGRQQAGAAGQLLAPHAWSRIVASPLSRAEETATIIATQAGLGRPDLDALRTERNYGEAAGTTWRRRLDARFPTGVEPPRRENARGGRTTRARKACTGLAEQHPGEFDHPSLLTAGVIRSWLGSVAARIDTGTDHEQDRCTHSCTPKRAGSSLWSSKMILSEPKQTHLSARRGLPRTEPARPPRARSRRSCLMAPTPAPNAILEATRILALAPQTDPDSTHKDHGGPRLRLPWGATWGRSVKSLVFLADGRAAARARVG